MTEINYLDQAAPLPLGVEQQSPGFILRPGKTEDVNSLAELFSVTYGQTTHPCQNPIHIYNAMISGLQKWFIVDIDSLIVGCLCIARRPWNQSWEVCYGMVHPDTRRAGLISSLVRLGLGSHFTESIELGFYITRNIASHSVMKKIRAAVLVGHDGGPDMVDGVREYHFTAIHPRAADGFRHIAPWYASKSGTEFISDYLYKSLSLEPVSDAYPATYLTGPQGTDQHGALLYSYDPAAKALMLSGYVGTSETGQGIMDELKALLQHWKSAEYVSACVLADKLELISSMIRLGFSITAYLPAWYQQDGARYDCILLVLQDFPQVPRSHGFDAEVMFFDQAYSRLTKHLCNISPN
ncbi:hypothetical protein [Pseudomonas sp. GM55]|uniref:hypothetical protein n=1 Tax=Pseudomonas sp. GM55 TaxID=1144333 RepID=UPI000270C5A9|nr:hypothetical protein [Pseudomonas sp. GM55]EJM78550.1 hypothetical protein PMI31_00364 [Pseudomonas sp. GM55]